VWMNFINFVYDLILTISWNAVPLSNDPVHLKIAWIVFITVILFTLVFRKYFYMKISTKKLNESDIEVDIDNEKAISFEKISDNIDEKIKKEETKKSTPDIKHMLWRDKKDDNKEELKDWDMEIFIGKEIK